MSEIEFFELTPAPCRCEKGRHEHLSEILACIEANGMPTRPLIVTRVDP